MIKPRALAHWVQTSRGFSREATRLARVAQGGRLAERQHKFDSGGVIWRNAQSVKQSFKPDGLRLGRQTRKAVDTLAKSR